MLQFHEIFEKRNKQLIIFTYFSDMYNTTHCFQGLGTTFSNLTITTNDNLFTAKHDIRSTFQAIYDGFSTRIQIVKSGFNHGIIDIHGGGQEFPSLSHLVQPMNSSNGLFHNSLKRIHLKVEILGIV